MNDWTITGELDSGDAWSLAKSDADQILAASKMDAGRLKFLARVFCGFKRAAETGTERRIAKFQAIEERLAALEAQQAEFRYCGVWTGGREYRRGNFVTHNGGIWHCNEDTGEKPGISNSWTLACKSGDR
jgi:hypothetical protein